jgi:hypothetical protein
VSVRTKLRRRRAATGRRVLAVAGVAVAAGALAGLLAVTAMKDLLPGAGGDVRASERAAAAGGGGLAGEPAAAGAAAKGDAPVVPIGERYTVVATRALDAPTRRDFSGVLPVGGGRLWLVDDKPRSLDSMLVVVGDSADAPLRPLRIHNPLGRPVGDDVEDLAALPLSGAPPRLLALVGERGPREAPVSWLALGLVDTAAGGSVSLVETREASPPGETIGNDGLEGVALLSIGADTVAVMTFKERTPPIYVRSYLYRWSPGDTAPRVERPLEPIGEPLLDHVPGVATQAAATFGPGGDLYVLDRYARRMAVVPHATVLAALQDPADNALTPREWIDFSALEPRLEGKIGAPGTEAPLSIFGTAEGVAFGADGTLYLLSDNNESGPSVLVTLAPRR